MNGLEIRSNLSKFEIEYLLLHAVAWRQKALCTIMLWLAELLSKGMCTQNSEIALMSTIGLSK